ncbi:MAG: M24 family metallopeptidase [Bryobacteraceae bacterium]
MTEIEQRRRRAADRLTELKIDALLISSPANVRYLSGFAGSNGLMLIAPGESHFFTDPRYTIEASENVTCKVHVAKVALITAAARVLKKRKGANRIGFETAWMHYEEFAKLREELPPRMSLHAVGRAIEEQRMIKSADEIASIRRSVQVNSEAYARILKRLKPGVRELDVAADIDYEMRRLGAENPAFETIVAAGARSALPHAHPGAHKLGANELLLIDMGASLNGYSSDMTRVVCAGSPSRQLRDLYKSVLESQLAAIDAVRPGVAAGKVDSVARDVLKRHALDREFIHSTGHGLGLEIHEPPRIGRKDKTRLQEGMAITIEPGAYKEGLGGIRIEDTVLVTANGCEVLTPTPKEFLSL